nr:hypothetical protein [uncultured Pseudomonas sp.]
MTAEQDVVKIRSKLSELRLAMMEALKTFSSIERNDVQKKGSALIEYQQKATAYFNSAENFVGDSELLGARHSKHWAQGFAEDCSTILESMVQHFELLRLEFNNLGLSPVESCEPSPTAFANMQRMVVQYLPKRQEALRKIFEDNRLPVYGFHNKAKNFIMVDKVLAFIFGLTFIIAIFVVAIFIPQPTDFQYKVFQTILSLAGAGIGAVIPGFLEVKAKGWIRAGGALAILVIFYFWSPASLVVQAQA